MRIKVGQDMATGLLFAFIGIGALVIGWDYPMGQWTRPGTGVLPAILSGLLILTGVVLIAKSLASGDSEITGINWMPLSLVTLAVVLFGFLIDTTVLNFGFFTVKVPGLGLWLAMAISMTVCALAIQETQWKEYTIFLIFMMVMAWAVFICSLGMPINACPSFAECQVCWLVTTPVKKLYETLMWVVR